MEAAADLADSVQEFITEVRGAVEAELDAESQPGIGHNRPPLISDELLDQMDAEAATVIAQAKAPAPDISVFYRFKRLIVELDTNIKVALIGGVFLNTADVISQLEHIILLFN